MSLTSFALMLNAIKVVRIITAFFFLVILSFSYAYLPLTLDINVELMGRVGRGHYFYTILGLFMVINLSSYFLRYYVGKIQAAPNQQLVIHSLAPVLYFSLTLLVGFVTVINNAQDIDPGSYNYLNYLSGGLVIGWILTFLFVSIRKK